jgi:hypothetical protein
MTMTIAIMTGHCNQDKIQKISAQGQHRIARTGCSAKTVWEIIIGSQKLENDNWDFILHCVFG